MADSGEIIGRIVRGVSIPAILIATVGLFVPFVSVLHLSFNIWRIHNACSVLNAALSRGPTTMIIVIPTVFGSSDLFRSCGRVARPYRARTARCGGGYGRAVPEVWNDQGGLRCTERTAHIRGDVQPVGRRFIPNVYVGLSQGPTRCTSRRPTPTQLGPRAKKQLSVITHGDCGRLNRAADNAMRPR